MTQCHPIRILLVEDNPADVRLTMETLKEAKVHHRIDHVDDGVEALAYLRGEGAYAAAALPDLIETGSGCDVHLFPACRIAIFIE